MKTSKFCQEQIVAPLKLVELPPRFESIKLKRLPARCRAGRIGAEHRVRTGDLRLGKATLYQLS